MSSTTTDTPAHVSERARSLLRGAYDMHVHIAPDVVARRIDDLALARRFAELGLGGFQLKSHYTSTAERAAVVRAAVPGVAVLGAIALNRAVGGMNPVAVEIAAREGARTVWFPTVDSVNESRRGDAVPAGREGSGLDGAAARAPRRRRRDRAGAGGRRGRRGAARDARGARARSHATGSCSRRATSPATRSSRSSTRRCEEGVREIVVTHPDFPSQSLSVDDQAALAEQGALLERCFTTPHTGKVTWERIFDAIRATGPEHSVLSTDLGQTANPPVEDGLGLMVDRLLAAGFDEEEIHTMAVVNTRRLAGADA